MTIAVGTRVRINDTYPYGDDADESDLKIRGREGEVVRVPEGVSIYHRVLLDGETYGTLYHEHELDAVDTEPKYLTKDTLANELYNLIVVKGRWGGVPKRGFFNDADNGGWETQPDWMKDVWREHAVEFARQNNFRLTD